MAGRMASDAILEYLSKVPVEPSAMEQHLLGTGAVESLERKMREHFHLPYALTVCNATSALFAAELALGLRGREVIASPFLYGATLSGALLLDNTIRFGDVDGTLNLNPEKIREGISRHTKAILSTDFNGVPADMFGLRRVADELGLWLIADGAQSFGAQLLGKPASSLADVVVTSFTCGKPLFAGEGAVVLTRHRDIYERMLWHTQHPCRQKREIGLHIFNEFGMNFRIHPLAAIWADSIFDLAITEIKKLQKTWLEDISELESNGIIRATGYSHDKIYPSFFRVLVQRQSKLAFRDSRAKALLSGLKVISSSLMPIYLNKTLKALYGSLVDTRPCPHAEALSRRDWVLLSFAWEGETCKTC
jgi:dTDP-4-amino-4,6-dideoxygalactose transaminase